MPLSLQPVCKTDLEAHRIATLAPTAPAEQRSLAAAARAELTACAGEVEA